MWYLYLLWLEFISQSIETKFQPDMYQVLNGSYFHFECDLSTYSQII